MAGSSQRAPASPSHRRCPARGRAGGRRSARSSSHRPPPAEALSTLDRRRQPLPLAASSRRRRPGCGARRPTSRSSATSSAARPTTRRRTSGATSSGCASTTATTCRSRPASTRRAGRPGCATSSTTAYRLIASKTFDERPPPRGHPAAQDEPAGRDHGVARQPRVDPDRLPRHRRSGSHEGLQGDERPGRRPALRQAEQERLRHEAEHEADRRPVQAVLHAVALRPEADDLGRTVRLDPAGHPEDDLDDVDGGRTQAATPPSARAATAPVSVGSAMVAGLAVTDRLAAHPRPPPATDPPPLAALAAVAGSPDVSSPVDRRPSRGPPRGSGPCCGAVGRDRWSPRRPAASLPVVSQPQA